MPGRAVLRIPLGVALVLAALGAVGAPVSRRRTVGGVDSDAFSLAAVCGGVERVSRAAALREAHVLACEYGPGPSRAHEAAVVVRRSEASDRGRRATGATPSRPAHSRPTSRL
jgi:hypothetical protein